MRQRVLITAGADGIGLEIAKCFLKKNALVWVADLNQNAIDNLPKSINARCVDVCDEIGMKALFDEISKTWGGLDVLCANAGIAGPTATIDQIALSDWQHCLKVNLDGTFIAAKYAASIFKKQGSGVINITSSTAGQYGYPNRSPYSTAKWGVLGLMKTLAMELGPFGVRVNAICPGTIKGDRMKRVVRDKAKFLKTTQSRIEKEFVSMASMNSWIYEDDIGKMCAFLISDDSSKVSGQVISVDGHTERND